MATNITSGGNVILPIGLKGIKNLIPHRAPILLIEEIREVNLEDETIVATKGFSQYEPICEGHFPNLPIMPGALFVEGAAQAGAALVKLIALKKGNAHLLGSGGLTWKGEQSFRTPVYPGHQIIFNVKITKRQSRAITFNAIVKNSSEKLITEVDFKIGIFKKPLSTPN